MKNFLFFFFFLCLYLSRICGQSDFHKDRIIVKIRDGVKLNITQKLLGSDKISVSGEGTIDELNNRYKCKQIKNLFTDKPDHGMEKWFTFMFPDRVNFDDLFNAYSKLSTIFEVVERYPIPVVGNPPFNDPLFNSTNSKSLFDSFFPNAWNIDPGGCPYSKLHLNRNY